MASNSQTATSPPPSRQTDRNTTPSPLGLRHRPPLRSSTFSTRENDLQRRASFFSEGLSETRKSFRASTDDLLLPRINTTSAETDEEQIETSHWHSVPLGLALLPAVGGIFFKDGSAVVTDITLLGLAAIFLNWALRLPWEWYKTAQSSVLLDEAPPQDPFSRLDVEDDDNVEADGESPTPKQNGILPESHSRNNMQTSEDEDVLAAQQELRLHQLLALVACFFFPLLGAWLLHAIRSQLSRPSEGLVSNYNLTIFLLVAEMRPLSHAIKLVQKRTLFLQKKVNGRASKEEQIEDHRNLSDLTKRLEELEAHVAENATNASVENTTPNVSADALVVKAASQASTDLRKAFQPELDALNRAMRRYEKRMTITAIQVESRLQDLETRLKDVVVLAAAAQRNADKHPRNYISILTNWVCAMFVVPVQYAVHVLSLPGKLAQYVLNWLKNLFSLKKKVNPRDNEGTQRASASRPRGAPKKNKAST